MTARQLWFTAPGQVEIREVRLPEPDAGSVLVRTVLCGISAGTERLVWRGEFPDGIVLDEGIESLKRPSDYPCPYGYNLIGRVSGRSGLVLAFQPHADAAVVPADSLIDLPDGWDAERAVLLPNAETAFNTVLDAAPRAGERVVVFGLGVVGLLVVSILADFPLERLIAVDPDADRRNRTAGLRGLIAIHPEDLPDTIGEGGADMVIELSGNPAALQSAIDSAGYSGRIIVGSWYGNKNVSLDLGTAFHRKRLSLVSSQVSTIAPALRGRWDSRRRIGAAMKWLGEHRESHWVTHRFPFEEAADAYTLIDGGVGDWLQVVLEP